MMSSFMPPPPVPLAHRRTRANTHLQYPPSPPYSPDSSSCALRKMSLSKGATFHVPSSPPAADDPVLSIHHLARRSPTFSQSSLMSLISDKQDVAAQSIKDFEQTFSGARGKRLSSRRRRPSHDFRQVREYNSTSSPVDEGLGSSISASSDKGLASSFERALSFTDSGLGSSVRDESVKLPRTVGITSEEAGLSVEDLIQGADDSGFVPSRTRQRGNKSTGSTSSTIRSAVTQSIAPPSSHSSSRQPRLSKFARQKLTKTVLDPILQEERFEFFHPFVSSLGSKANTSIGCLRDLEQRLIFQPLEQTLAVSHHLYRSFGEFSIQLVLDAFQHLSESEQRRPTDRPYDNGYFLDLVQQVGRLAAQVGRARQAAITRAEFEAIEEEDEMAYSPYVSSTIDPRDLDLRFTSSDEVTLEGGLGETGEIAELVRWKNGKPISLRTNLPYEPLPGIKRQHSNEALDNEVARSMARRKKGVVPQIVEMKCSDKTCDKIFTRKCDLAKHEKTHSRPFKCPEPKCKYHVEGLPTEKEMQRHVNDKHSANPHYFHCRFCSFKTKRESNCKQHMEKKHDWVYERVKGSSKTVKTPGQTPQTPSIDYSPSPAPSYRQWDDASSVSGSLEGSVMHTPQERMQTLDFNTMPGATSYPGSLFPRQYVQTSDDFGFETSMQAPASAIAYPSQSPYLPLVTPVNPTSGSAAQSYGRSPITPAYSTITYDQSPYMDRMKINVDYTSPDTYTGLPTPNSNFLQPHSRNPSISYESPMAQGPSEQSLMDNTMTMEGMSSDVFVSHSQLPEEDFALFEGPGPSNYSSHAGPSTVSQSFFPDMNDDFQSEYFCGDDSMFGIENYLNLDQMGN